MKGGAPPPPSPSWILITGRPTSCPRGSVALIKQELDACGERDIEEILADLLWTAWPTVWSQDQ